VPLMLGTTATEVTFFPNASFDPLDAATLRMRVKETLRTDDAQADQVIAVYRKSRPKASNLDLFLVLATDASQFRGGVDTQAERKAAQGKAPAYVYRFEWYSPVREGKLRSFHCLEIPFVFDNVDGCQEMTGSGSDRQPLADKMSKAWVAFARTGNPSHSGIPKWEPFNANQRPTMVFDKDCKFVNDPHGDERKAIATAQAAARTSAGGDSSGGAGL
jgi:para-nitrobenzyl esterase